jgi:predicted 3-demethylubiquinone-9 3-methyltransferase (glyoxalase superfamily)
MEKITPCLWFDGNAEEAANFYVSLFPDSRIDQVHRAAADNPSTRAGDVLVVQFTLAGRAYIGLNGGPLFHFNEAVSFQIDCTDQMEVDRLWEKLIAHGGSPSECGWCKDRFGLSWQVTPNRLTQLLASPDAAVARRVMESMMTMSKIDIATLEKAARGD